MTKGSISLLLDRPYYIAGEIITGNCMLTITEPVQATSLIIKWKGMERTKFEISRTETYQQNGETKFRTVVDKHKQEQTFFKTQLLLANYQGGTVAPGTYQFPFQFQLPNELPGNFNDHKHVLGSEYRGAIVYKVKSNLDNVVEKDIKDTKYLFVVPRSMTIPQPVTCKNEKSFLFGGSGKLYMDVQIGKNVFQPGEMIPVHVVIDNQSKKKVDKLKVKLMRDITLKCKGHNYSYSEEVNRNEFQGVDKKAKLDNVLNYQLPKDIYPSTTGSMISCKYHLDIECDVAMAFDLEVHPVVEIIYMPAMGQPVFNIYGNMPKGCWQ